VRGQNLNFRQFAQGHDALVGPAERDAAVGAGVQAISRMEDLIGLRDYPGGRARGGDFHFALEFQDADLTWVRSRRVSTAWYSADCKPKKDRGQQRIAPACKQWLHGVSSRSGRLVVLLAAVFLGLAICGARSEEHTSEL